VKLISWNVNGLRACMNKGFMDFFTEADADAVCIQETKMQREQAEVILPGYKQYWNSAVKKGYSGTAIFTRMEPLSVQYDIDDEQHVGEGRSITLEFKDFYLVTVYTPNAQRELARLEYRMSWETAFRAYLKRLDEKKPVVVCGDMNVAHNEIDLKNPKSNVGNAGFSNEERAKMTELLTSGFVDTFRYLYPEQKDAYTWWSYMFHAREKNVGWRIDYFLVSERIRNKIEESKIHCQVMGSDHCPIELVLSSLQ
jgi:exodeoxyribonuclease-3